MKLAILTQPLASNYGGILQCYALQTTLTRLGHSVVVLSRSRPPAPWWKNWYWLAKRCWLYYVRGNKRYSPFPRYTTRRWNTVTRNLRSFISRRIHATPPIYTTRALRQCVLSQHIEGVVYGSDQIWRPSYSPDILNYFGSFLAAGDRIRQIAYAASFGVDQCEFSPIELQACSALLRRFEAVSVRENSGIALCRTRFGVDACQMIDPTMLLRTEDYVRLIEQADTKPSGGDLLIFVLDRSEEKRAVAEAVAESGHLRPWDIGPKINDPSLSLEDRILMPVEQWLRGFREARMVVTDSFHGCVFSILFGKPFIAVGNASRGMTRFTSLLQLFGLENRLVRSLEEFRSRQQEFWAPIDYAGVQSRMEQCREEALHFLKRNLSESTDAAGTTPVC